jgi:DNA-binding transcriptional LysR family regulator
MVGCHAASLDPEEAKLRWGAWFESDPLVEGIVAGIDGARIVFRTNDLAGMRSACVHGMASVMLPEPLVPLLGLARLDAVVVDGPPMWLAAPAPSLELPRVRALWDTIAGLWDDAF